MRKCGEGAIAIAGSERARYLTAVSDGLNPEEEKNREKVVNKVLTRTFIYYLD